MNLQHKLHLQLQFTENYANSFNSFRHFDIYSDLPIAADQTAEEEEKCVINLPTRRLYLTIIASIFFFFFFFSELKTATNEKCHKFAVRMQSCATTTMWLHLIVHSMQCLLPVASTLYFYNSISLRFPYLFISIFSCVSIPPLCVLCACLSFDLSECECVSCSRRNSNGSNKFYRLNRNTLLNIYKNTTNCQLDCV